MFGRLEAASIQLLWFCVIVNVQPVGVLFDEEFFLGPMFCERGFVEWYSRYSYRALVVMGLFVLGSTLVLMGLTQ